MNKIGGVPLVLIGLVFSTTFLVVMILTPMLIDIKNEVKKTRFTIEAAYQAKPTVTPMPTVEPTKMPVKAVKATVAPSASTSGR